MSENTGEVGWEVGHDIRGGQNRVTFGLRLRNYYAKHPNTIFLGKFCGVYTELLFNGTYFRVFYANAMVVFHW